MHVSNLYGSPQGEALAQRIVDNSFADTVFFTNSGVEAIECAIKTARRYHDVNGNPERYKLITFKNAFHGRSLGAISATDQSKMRDGFEPLLPGFDYAPFNDLEGALALIDDETAGFLVETVQGEGGMTAGTPEFIQGLRKACDEHGLLLILDEIQCGYGRTGKMWAYEHYGITPDIMTVGQGHRRGLPARRVPGDRGSRQGHGDRHPRLDLWRQSAGDGGGAGGARRDAGARIPAPRGRDGRPAARGVRAVDPEPRPSVRGNPRQGADARASR